MSHRHRVHPRGGLSVAREIEVACAHTLPRLSAESRLTKRLAAEAEQEEEL